MILFVITLLLAIPTYGISVIVYICLILIRGKLASDRISKGLHALRSEAYRNPLILFKILRPKNIQCIKI